MAIEGRLGAGGGADLLSALWQQERTGILELAAGGADRKLVLVAGEIVYALSSETAEKLPVRLLAGGLVGKAALVEAAKAGGDLRAALAARSLLAPEAHDRELAALVEAVVTAAFPLTEGKYAFVDRDEVQVPGMLASLDMTPVFWRAARRAPPEFAARFLGNHAQRVVRAPSDELLARLPGLQPAEGYVISRIDGYSSVHDLIGLSPLGEAATLQLLLGLTVVGFADVAGRPGVKLPRPSKSPSKKRAAASAPAPAARPASAPVAAPATSAAGAAPQVPHLPKEGESLLDAARELLARAKQLDHYALLGVKPTASDDDIRRAYYALARSYHPDRVGKDAPAEHREVVESLFALIGEAFGVLSDEALRHGYDDRLKSGQAAADRQEKKVDRKDIARESFAKGRAALAAGDRAAAQRLFEHAAETDHDNWDFRMALARLLASDPRTRRRSEQHLLEAIRIDQTKADAYHELAVVYRSANLRSRALEKLREGLKWDATHEGILRELAELGERK